jgi:hypothetical protein
MAFRASYAAKAGKAVLEDPYEGIERIRERLSERWERRGRPYPHPAASNWRGQLHELLGLPWPCPAEAEFRSIWSALVSELAARPRTLGRGTFGGWDDAGPALAQAVFCLTIHLRPEKVLETGVAHGVTTRFILEGLARNRKGGLWSIDLPPLIEKSLEDEIAIAVPDELRPRWTLIKGSSRRRLPDLLGRLGSIGLFVHDSMHTARNLRFELDHCWPSLDSPGAVVADDVDYNPGFREFTAALSGARSLVAPHDDGEGLFGIIVKEPAGHL